MNSFNVVELKENTYFTQDVVIDKTFLLLTNSIPVSQTLIKSLLAWDFRQVFSDGTLGSGTASNDSFDISSFQNKEEELNIKKNQHIDPDILKNATDVDASIFTGEITADSDKNRLSIVQTVYNDYYNYINQVYTRYATHKELNIEELSAKAKDFVIFVKENRRFVLRIQPTLENKNKNFLISHSMRSTVFAITIGLQMRLPLSKLIELGVACILHEIGMIRLPPQLYMTDRTLSQNEKNTIFTHPIISYNILKENDFPLNISLGVLEHHEKENGTGYPRKLGGDKISTYAKIISVACAFEAITAPRHYKEASSSHEAMIEMLKNNGQVYDSTVIKALLLSLSLYPIGGYVLLSNGKVAQVTDVNPENPQNPIVQILNEFEPSGEPKTINTGSFGLKIARVLTKENAMEIAKIKKPEAVSILK